MSTEVFDTRPCTLGEGPLWHPERGQLFWFDIIGKRLLTNGPAGPQDWDMGEHATAAGWIDDHSLLIASESSLSTLDLTTGARDTVAPLEADNPVTRSNDGRADPQGGFWIGTMGKQAEAGAGAIYRFHKGELRQLYDTMTIPNAICFAPSGDHAYFADSRKRTIYTVPLDSDGWPDGEPQPFLTLDGKAAPDGAVCDAAGNLWNAQWGAGRVAAYAPDGRFLQAFDLPAIHTTCPAFGGADLCDLFVTSAREAIAPADLTESDGQTFRIPGAGQGQAEHRVIL